MKRAIFAIIAILFLFSFANVSFAAYAFGAQGGKGTDGSNSYPASSKNIGNWPLKAQDMCIKAQDNALKKCEEFAKGYDPGGWWIDRSIIAKTSSGKPYQGKDINVNIEDLIIGKWDCPPHNLLVDDNGNYIEQLKIYPEHIDYNNYEKKGTDEEDVEIVCSFSCHAWPCPTANDLNPKSDCTDFEFIDKNGDGKDDKTGKAADEFAKGKVEGKLGMNELCEWKPGCTLYGYSKNLIKGKNEGQYFLRVCAECSCPWLVLEPTYDPGSYTPLEYDPFKDLDDAGKTSEKIRIAGPEMTFDSAAYTLAGAMQITVHDDAVNNDANSKEIVGVRISSSSNPNGRIYELTETAPDSGIFTLTSKVRDFINKQGIIALHYTYYNASGHQKILSSSVEVRESTTESGTKAKIPTTAAKKENNKDAPFADYRKGTIMVNHNLRKGWNMIQAKNWVDLGSCKGKLWGGYIFSPVGNQYFGGQMSGNQLDFTKDAAKMKNEAGKDAYYHLSNHGGAFVYAYEDCDMTIELHDNPGNFVLGKGWNFFTFQPHMVGKSLGEALGHCRYSSFIAFNAWNPDEQNWFWEQNNFLKGPFSNYEGLDDTAEIEEKAVGASYIIYVPEACSLAPLSLSVIVADEEISEEDFELIASPDMSVSTKSDEEKEKMLSQAKQQFNLSKTACIEIDKGKQVLVTTTKNTTKKNQCDDGDPKTKDACETIIDVNLRAEGRCLHIWHEKIPCEYGNQYPKIKGERSGHNCPSRGVGSVCIWWWLPLEKRVCGYFKRGKPCDASIPAEYLGSTETVLGPPWCSKG
ncbi:hypothetical protein HYY71_06295 [Candidatus Woesearchaeota archaeon]|nr:hypothetical protein [Candidatus Woesearchaeota archaeon]